MKRGFGVVRAVVVLSLVAGAVSAVQLSVTVLSPAATGLVKVAANGTAVVPVAALTYTGGGGSISASSITALPADGKIQVFQRAIFNTSIWVSRMIP